MAQGEDAVETHIPALPEPWLIPASGPAATPDT